MNRLDGTFNRGEPTEFEPLSRMKAFQALYRFDGRTFGLLVWMPSLEDAETYCRERGMVCGGEVIEVIPS